MYCEHNRLDLRKDLRRCASKNGGSRIVCQRVSRPLAMRHRGRQWISRPQLIGAKCTLHWAYTGGSFSTDFPQDLLSVFHIFPTLVSADYSICCGMTR